MVENKKNLWLALAGLGAVAVAALAIYALGGESAESDEAVDMEMLKAAGIDEVKREGDMIDSKYFLKLLQFIGEKTRDTTKAKRDGITAERRKCYEAKDWEGYREQVQKSATLEDETAQRLLQEAIAELGISEQEFSMTHRMLASNEQTAQFVMAAQQGKLKEPAAPGLQKKPTLTKNKMMDALKHHMESTIVQMVEMQKKQMNPQGDQMSMMVDMMVEQAKLADDMFLSHKVESDEFEENLMHYMSHDPQVQQSMRQYMMKMQMMQGGGFPGMGQ